MINTEKLNLLLKGAARSTAAEEFIYGVTPRGGRGTLRRINDFFIDRSAVPLKEKSYFFSLLSIMLRAGIPLNRSLKILSAKVSHARLKRVIATVSHEIEHGRPFSDSLKRFPDVFLETEVGVITAAESIGTLEQTLAKLAATLDKRTDLNMRLKSALIYPAAVVAALAAGFIIMLTVVVPRIEIIFKESALALPATTRVLLTLSIIASKWWWLAVIFALFGIIAFHFYTHTEEGRFSWDFQKLKLPLIGGVLRKIIVMRFTDTLGLLLENGLPINRALEITAGSIGNEVYRVKIYEALAAVHEGKRLSESLGSSAFLFPETVVNMVAVGESTATLGELMSRIGDHFEREIDYTLKNATTVLGPVIILILGLTVAFFALAVLSPIFSLTQAL